MELLLLGLNHTTAPIELRERLAFSPTALRSALTHFDKTHHHEHIRQVNEGVILSTCNRLEVYALTQDEKEARDEIVNFLARSFSIEPDEFVDHLYVHHNSTAVRHMMRVSAGLDSMVLGEPQILGQITEAYEAALSQGAAGTVLSALCRAAIHTGKRARTETTISVNPSSVSSVAAGAAQSLLGDLSDRRALLIGAGEMGATAMRALINRGTEDVVVVNRTFKNAEQLAHAWGGRAATFQQLTEELTAADIVISSTGAPHTILNVDYLTPVVEQRGGRPLLLIDIALPRDIDPDVTGLDGVHLLDLDDLQEQATYNIQEREAEVPHVEEIVNEEVEEFLNWQSSLDVKATVTDLRSWVEGLRQSELERFFNRVEVDEREREQIETLTHRLINKILHPPTLQLKKEAAKGNAAPYSETVRHLFQLDTSLSPDRTSQKVSKNGAGPKVVEKG